MKGQLFGSFEAPSQKRRLVNVLGHTASQRTVWSALWAVCQKWRPQLSRMGPHSTRKRTMLPFAPTVGCDLTTKFEAPPAMQEWIATDCPRRQPWECVLEQCFSMDPPVVASCKPDCFKTAKILRLTPHIYDFNRLIFMAHRTLTLNTIVETTRRFFFEAFAKHTLGNPPFRSLKFWNAMAAKSLPDILDLGFVARDPSKKKQRWPMCILKWWVGKWCKWDCPI